MKPGNVGRLMEGSLASTPRAIPTALKALAVDSSAASFLQVRESYVKQISKSIGKREPRACDKGRRAGGMVGFT